MRVLAAAAGAVLVMGGSSASGQTAAPVSAPGRVPRAAVPSPVSYAAPLAPLRVLRRFDALATPYGPGHLGVDLATTPDRSVRSAGAGVVTFAGVVAGRGLIVVLHADGIRTEYEPVRPSVSQGDVVRRGAAIGAVNGTHAGCAAGRCLHWGARRGEQYLDPLLLLRPLGTVRLMPWTP